MAQLPSVKEMEAYIRAKARELGIDPDIAVKVARSEGLQEGTWQGKSQLAYGREQSYGPFQLHRAPQGYRPGMGNDYYNDTGLDPADPANWRSGVDYALGKAKTGGWGPWFGAKAVGVTGMEGINGAPGPQALPPRPTDTVAQPGGLLGPSQAMQPPAPVTADASPSQTEPTIPGSGASSKWEALGNMAQNFAKEQAPQEEPFQWLVTPQGIIRVGGDYKPLELSGHGGLLG